MPEQEIYTVPATTKAERDQMEAHRQASQTWAKEVDEVKKNTEANTVQVDDSPAPEQAADGVTFYVTPEEEIPYLLEEIGRLTRANAQLRVTCMKLLRERSGG